MQHMALQRKPAPRDDRPKRGHTLADTNMEFSRQRPIRVFVADRHEIIRVGMRALLEGESDCTVVGEVEHVDGLLAQVRRAKPDVIILESRLALSLESDGDRRVCETLPSVKIIVLMDDHDAGLFTCAIETGIQGYLSKRRCQRELVQAIRMVAKGGSYVCSETAVQTSRLLRQRQHLLSARSGVDALSPQERRVIALIAEGNTNKEIAVTLKLSEKTVKNYIANMFSKLAINRRTQAAALYVRDRQHHDQWSTLHG